MSDAAVSDTVTDRGRGEPRPSSLWTPSVVVLVAANLVPVYGVVVLRWSVFEVVALFWFENVVIGVFNVARMWMAAPERPGLWMAKLGAIPFFVVHYGMFTFVHGIFVLMLFGSGLEGVSGMPGWADLFGALRQAGLAWAATALVLSHGVSYVRNYLLSGEFRRATLETLMRQPYARVVVLHLVIIGSGFLVMAFGLPAAALVLLVVLKVGVDVAAHVREHRKLGVVTA